MRSTYKRLKTKALLQSRGGGTSAVRSLPAAYSRGGSRKIGKPTIISIEDSRFLNPGDRGLFEQYFKGSVPFAQVEPIMNYLKRVKKLKPASQNVLVAVLNGQSSVEGMSERGFVKTRSRLQNLGLLKKG